MATNGQKRKAREKAREWIRDHVSDNGPEIQYPVVARAAMDHFFESDRPTLRALVEDQLYQVFYHLTGDVVKRGREHVVIGETAVEANPEALRDHLNSKSKSVFSDWYERIGDGHKALLKMCKPELIVADAIRTEHIDNLSARRDFIRMLAKGMDDQKTPVEKQYSVADLLTMWNKAQQRHSDKAEAS